jgi:AcrR family transcriptional regulator
MAYRRTETVDARLADKRKRIAAAARRIVADGGFGGATVAAIASVAEVSTGSVYSYFPSKADLMAEVVASVSECEVQILRSIASSEEDAPERLRHGIETFVKRACTGRRLAYALIVEPADAAIDAVRLHYRRQVAEVFAAILRDGIARNAFREIDVEAASAAIVGAFMEALIGPLSPDRPVDAIRANEVATALSNFCLAAVARPATPTAA